MLCGNLKLTMSVWAASKLSGRRKNVREAAKTHNTYINILIEYYITGGTDDGDDTAEGNKGERC